jgi:anti-sigma factor RsiW
MRLRAEDQSELRRYLLGDLAGAARERVERRLLTEPDFLEELLVGEEELIDEYVGGQTSAGDRLKFERHFLSTPERRRQLGFARALSRYVADLSG